MSFLLKNRETLTLLFTTFSLQELLQVNKNLSAAWHLLTMPPEQLLNAMNAQQVNIEDFLGKKCLPLIRFYLADEKQQKAHFLSADKLAQLFTSLPAVEAVVFKEQIDAAQLALQDSNQMLSALLVEEKLDKQVQKRHSIVKFKGRQATSKRSLSLLVEDDKEYMNCFYYLNGDELYIVAERQVLDADMLLYSELSPLQQLQAQKLFKLGCEIDSNESMARQSVPA
ncbi:MAG: hypothetical protein GY951_10730 [Psychromonas sp.]|nr:hypothetical protein [Alteromonadales bacterium]MCP5078513.1 hypothetical protein [Psychromonas sp.]